MFSRGDVMTGLLCLDVDKKILEELEKTMPLQETVQNYLLDLYDTVKVEEAIKENQGERTYTPEEAWELLGI